MKLKEFKDYAADLRSYKKKELEYAVSEGIERKIGEFKEMTDMSCSLDVDNLQKRLKDAAMEKQLLEKILSSDDRLTVCLESMVRDSIIALLTFIADGPKMKPRFKMAGKWLEGMCFADAREYLSEFETVEDVRRDLFEQAGLEYISIDELAMSLDEAYENLDYEKYEKCKADYEKAGIDMVTGQYVRSKYSIYEIAVFNDKRLELLTSRRKGNSK